MNSRQADRPTPTATRAGRVGGASGGNRAPGAVMAERAREPLGTDSNVGALERLPAYKSRPSKWLGRRARSLSAEP